MPIKFWLVIPVIVVVIAFAMTNMIHDGPWAQTPFGQFLYFASDTSKR
jgi:hypothetical protein